MGRRLPQGLTPWRWITHQLRPKLIKARMNTTSATGMRPQLFDAQAHQAEAEGAQHHHLRCLSTEQHFSWASTLIQKRPAMSLCCLLLGDGLQPPARIKALRQVRPCQVFVASDGPRTPGEACSVQTTRELINSEIDWPCQLHTRFSKVNQGCQQGVSSAITWFFDHVDEGIILEDDCVPHADFFEFSAQMLKRYQA